MTLRERLTASVTDIRARGQRLVQLNLELLTSELKEKGRKFGAAIGLFAAAGVFALYAIGFALATIAVLLALVLPLWAAMLIVTAALFALVAILVLVGRDQLRKIGDPQPTAAIAEAKATADLVKANARGTAAGVRARMRPRPAGPTGGQAPVSAAASPAVPSGTGPGVPVPPSPGAQSMPAPDAPPPGVPTPSDPGAKDS